MILLSLIVVLVGIVTPAALVIFIWRQRTDRVTWLLSTLFVASFVAWLFLSGPWDWIGYWLRRSLSS
ncbi:MAG: hypothetical protein ACE5GX_01790 [Thermoanaerobaculia bacterium]